MDLLILYFEMKNKEIGAIINSKAVEKIAKEVTASLFSSIELSSPKPTKDKSTPDNIYQRLLVFSLRAHSQK